MSAAIFAIDHVQITVPKEREAESIAFYRDVLGLKQIEKPEALRARGGAWFQVGPTQMHIGLDNSSSPGGKRHICFLVFDLDRAKSHVSARGIKIEEDGTAEGLVRFFVRDPAGNRVEIGQR